MFQNSRSRPRRNRWVSVFNSNRAIFWLFFFQQGKTAFWLSLSHEYVNNTRISNVLLDVSRFQWHAWHVNNILFPIRFLFKRIIVFTARSVNFSFPLLRLVWIFTLRSKLDHLVHVYTARSKLDLLVYVYTPRKTKVRFIILPNKQVQPETTFQMSDIFSLVCSCFTGFM